MGLILVTVLMVFTHYLIAMSAIAMAAGYLLLPEFRNKERVSRLVLVGLASLVCGIYIVLAANPYERIGSINTVCPLSITNIAVILPIHN